MADGGGDIDTGVAAHRAGRLSEAAEIYRHVLGREPDNPHALHLLGVVEHQAGNHARAAELIGDAVMRCPEQADFLSNLGAVRSALGQPDVAAECCRRALALAPNHVDALTNLGGALRTLGETDQAMDCLRRALAVEPTHRQALTLLTNELAEQGRAVDALAFYRKAVRLAPDREVLWLDLVKALQRAHTDDPDAVPRRDLIACLANDAVHHFSLVAPVVDAMRATPELADLIGLARRRDRDGLAGRIASGAALVPLSDRLITLSLDRVILCDPDLEALFTEVRAALLDLAVAGRLPADFAGERRGVVFSLANQCFLTEYVYFQSEPEAAKLAALERLVEGALRARDPGAGPLAALMACYAPLHRAALAPSLTAFAGTVDDRLLAALARRQIDEPAEELRLRDTIPVLTPIEDAVSAKVRAQYEENPYPRWRTAQSMEAEPLDVILKNMFPFLTGEDVRQPAAPEVLVAGCGSGQHAILCANRFLGARILAVDLSLTSLAYASRKAPEAGIAAIDFAQADLLELGRLDRAFDLVACSGVLHHLADPLAGWRVLTDLLVPGGFMNIGLYSTTARRHIAATRSLIAKHAGLRYRASQDGIRTFRRDLRGFAAAMGADGEAALRPLWTAQDFYSTSACRDLLFHVQEHTFTLPQIGDMMAELGLEFLSFALPRPQVKQAYLDRFPEDPEARSLENWDAFETANPATFIGMYNFWARKPAR